MEDVFYQMGDYGYLLSSILLVGYYFYDLRKIQLINRRLKELKQAHWVKNWKDLL